MVNSGIVTIKWLLLGGAAALCGLAGFLFYFSKPRALTTVLEIFPEKLLLEHFHLIRKKYSKSVKKHMIQSRRQRRSFRLGSEDHLKLVRKCHNALNMLLRQAIDETLEETKYPWRVYDDSMKYYSFEPHIVEAEQEMKIPLNRGHIPIDLTVDLLREILNYYRDRLDTEHPLKSSYSTPIVLYLIEDEIYEKFGFEIEDVERAYDSFWEHLREHDILIMSIRKGKLIDDVEGFQAYNY